MIKTTQKLVGARKFVYTPWRVPVLRGIVSFSSQISFRGIFYSYFFFFCSHCWIRTLSKYIDGEPNAWNTPANRSTGRREGKVFTVMREDTSVPTTYRYYHYYCCVLLLLLLFGTRCARRYDRRSLLRCAAPRQRPRGTYTHTVSRFAAPVIGIHVVVFAVVVCTCALTRRVQCIVGFVRFFFATIQPNNPTVFVRGRFRIDPNCVWLYDIIVRFKRAAAATEPKGFIAKILIVPKNKLLTTIKYR